MGISMWLGTEFKSPIRITMPTIPKIISNWHAEALHHTFYTAYFFDRTNYGSWMYARLVDILWQNYCDIEVVLTPDRMVFVYNEIVFDIEQEFNVPAEEIYFSIRTLRKAFKILRELDPPVLKRVGRYYTFSCRYYCSPIIFLWAVDFLYRVKNHPYGVRMSLRPDVVEQLQKLCVLHPLGFDNVLMMTKRLSDYERGGVFDYGWTGAFGRWMLLARPCPVSLETLREGKLPYYIC